VHTDFPRVLEHAADLLGRTGRTPCARRKKEPPVDELGPATAKWDYLDAAAI
jgi:putative DNA primase/helicase